MDKFLKLTAMDLDRDFSEMYETYIRELWDRKIIKKMYGFITYELCKDFIYISDLFIEKMYRDQGMGRLLEAEVVNIGIVHGYDKIQCKIHRSDKTWRTNYEIYTRHCGYKMIDENEDFIRLEKSIGRKL